MYARPEAGTAHYEIFNWAATNAQAMAELQIETDAIERRGASTITDCMLETGGINGFEALLRWHPQYDLLNPAEF